MASMVSGATTGCGVQGSAALVHVAGANETFSSRCAEAKEGNASRHQNAVMANDSELVGKLRNLSLGRPVTRPVTEGPGSATQTRVVLPPRAVCVAAPQQGGGGKEEEVSVTELACYLEDALTLPRPMSYMASLMYN